MNKVVLIGRLTSKPELRYNQSNLPYTRFSLAVNRDYTNNQGQREADFINIVAWRKQAENVCNFLDKGSLVAVDGSIQTGSYENNEGKRIYTVDVIANRVQFLESKKNNQSNSTPLTNGQVNNFQQASEGTDPFADFGDTVTIDDNFLD